MGVGLVKDKAGIQSFDLPKPEITQPDHVLVRVKQVGLDGTDFNIVRYDLQDMADGQETMALGHELLGVVERVGSDVRSLASGDTVTMTVRRGCGQCQPCLHNESDMCMTGLFTERGIHKLHGALSEYVVDEEQYVVKVPPGLEDIAVLTEPLSIVEKAIEEIRIIQSRMLWTCSHQEHRYLSDDWGGCKFALVVGAGPLGLLGAALLRLADVATVVTDIVPKDHPKAQRVAQLGASYVEGHGKTAEQLMEVCTITAGNLDIVLEASGAADMAVQIIQYMTRDSIYVMTGIPREGLNVQVDAGQIVRQMVRYNQVLVGSVNSNRTHFEMALRDIPRIVSRFPGFLEGLFTRRLPLARYEEAFAAKGPGDIKTLIRVSE